MTINVDIWKRLKEIRIEAGLNQDQMADHIGVHKQTLSRYERGTLTPSNRRLDSICEEFNINPLWLLTGEGEMKRGYPLPEGVQNAVSDVITTTTYGNTEFVFIPQVTGEISAGGGLIADDTIEMRIAFRREWVERKGDHNNMSLIRVSGDSMEPTLLSGDLVLIDHNRNFIDPQGGIYAIAAGNIIMIKRLQVNFLTRRIKVISDNPKYDSSEVEQEKILVNGKVIWYGREIER